MIGTGRPCVWIMERGQFMPCCSPLSDHTDSRSYHQRPLRARSLPVPMPVYHLVMVSTMKTPCVPVTIVPSHRGLTSMLQGAVRFVRSLLTLGWPLLPVFGTVATSNDPTPYLYICAWPRRLARHINSCPGGQRLVLIQPGSAEIPVGSESHSSLPVSSNILV